MGHSCFQNYGIYMKLALKYGFIFCWLIYIVAALAISEKRAAPLFVLTLFVFHYYAYDKFLKDEIDIPENIISDIDYII
jgi:hypothetical protein